MKTLQIWSLAITATIVLSLVLFLNHIVSRWVFGGLMLVCAGAWALLTLAAEALLRRATRDDQEEGRQ